MFITIDPYYNYEFYRECKEALKNNGVSFNEYVSIKAPHYWYFEIDDSNKPVFINYDTAEASTVRWLVNVVKPIETRDEVELLRRHNDNTPKELLRYIENEPLREARHADYACFFTVSDRQDLIDISKLIPEKIWYLGNYCNKYRLCLCCNKYIENLVDSTKIILRKSDVDSNEIGRLESELNYKIFQGRDRLVKYTKTQYALNGKFHRPVRIDNKMILR